MTQAEKMDELFERIFEQTGERLSDVELWVWLSLHHDDVEEAVADAKRAIEYRQLAEAR